MRKCIVSVLLFFAILLALGCGNPTTPAPENQTAFEGVSPVLTGVVGSYTYTGKDGTIDSGKLIADEKGNITLVPERGSSVCSCCWFTCSIDYLNPRFYTGMGLPVYYLGDTLTYRLGLDYHRGIPLNLWPILYAKLTTEQRYYPCGGLLPGDPIEVWDPIEIPPFGYIEVCDDYEIPMTTIPGNDATWVKVDMEFLCGWFEFNMTYGICGLWDP